MKRLLRNWLLTLLWMGVARKVKAEQPRVIAVTGSVGKTSAKEAIALVLAQGSRPVLKTHGNLNSDTGIPISLLGFKQPPANFWQWLSIIWRALFPPLAQEKNSYYVLEYSSDQPGDMRFLTDHLPPDVAVITQIAPVHLQHFANLDELIQEELAVTKGLKKEGTLLFNADDPWQKDCSQEVSQKVGFSITKAQLNYQPDQVGLIVNNTSYTTKLLGVHQEQAVLIAITLGELEGIAPEKIQKAILQYEVPPGRGRVLHGRSDWVIIDDSHNASPEAVKAALVMLKTVASARRRVAVLGQMNELGPDADRLHEAVGQAVPTNADVLIAIGSCAEATKRGALAAGMLAAAIYTFATPTEAAKLMESIFQPGDAILFKASQNGMRFERLIKPLLLHPADSSKLTRQSSYWLTHA